jgi:sarcosine oxidase gamma subunit
MSGNPLGGARAASLPRLQRLPLERCFEFVAHARVPDADWPAEPGQVLRDGAGRAVLLHFAPGRWLVPAPDERLRTRLDALARDRHGALVDVDGKWQALALALAPATASRVLASGVEVEALLRGRDTAAIVLFDCPLIVVRAGAGFELYVAASYLHSFEAAVESLRLPD